MGYASALLVNELFVLTVGTLALVLVVLAVIVFAFLFQRNLLKKQRAYRQIEVLLQQQELKSAYAILQGQEQERKRIAEDLHDRLGSRLAAVKLHLHAYKNKSNATDEFFSTAENLLDGAVEEVREISHNMVSGVLSKFGLVAALQDLRQTLERSNAIKVDLHTWHLAERLNLNVEINLYRIVQELISNVLKHANASEITIQLNRYESQLLLTIEDNGTGFDIAEANAKRGMGLKNLHSRVYALEGKINIDSGQGNGTTVTIEIPITS